jgi:hypothetical protein
MNTQNKISKRAGYIQPVVKKIVLDNEISLALESSPPFGPGESSNKVPEYFNNNPLNA